MLKQNIKRKINYMKIQISGIKSLKEFSCPVHLNRLTFITGKNSSGKSSFTSGINLLSNILQNNKIHDLQDFFRIKLTGNEQWLNENINFISNGNAIDYSIELKSIIPLTLYLSFSKKNTYFELQKLECQIQEEPLLIIQKKIVDDVEMFQQQLLPGNLDKQTWKLLENAFEIHSELSSDINYRNLCKRYLEKASLTIDIEADMDLYLEGISSSKINDLSTPIGKEFILIISTYLNDSKTKNFLQYIQNKYLDLDIFNVIEKDNSEKLIDQLKKIFLAMEFNPLVSYSSQGSYSDKEVIESGINCAIGGLMEEDMQSCTKEYLIKAEGMIGEMPVDSYDYGPLIQLNKNCRAYKLSFIIQDWIKAIIRKELHTISEFQFDNHLKTGVKRYFTERDSSQIHTISEFFYDNPWSNGLMNDYIKMMEIGNSIVFEKHLHGEGYMVFITDNNSQKINIGSLGSGHYYLLLIGLTLIYKFHIRDKHLQDKMKETFIEEEVKDYPIKLILTEPETHLHPNLQSLFCNVITKLAVNYNTSFIIETHSEYFIRSIQLEIARNSITNKDVSLYYFENEKNKGTCIKQIRINNQGFLLDKFGSGFLDESQNKIEQLFKIKQN
jgi:predicted ATPase